MTPAELESLADCIKNLQSNSRNTQGSVEAKVIDATIAVAGHRVSVKANEYGEFVVMYVNISRETDQ